MVFCVFLQGEKKTKKTTKTEKYWDWELANETKPIWVSKICEPCLYNLCCWFIFPYHDEFYRQFLFSFSFHLFSFYFVLNTTVLMCGFPLCCRCGTQKKLKKMSTTNSIRRLSMNFWIPLHTVTSQQRYCHHWYCFGYMFG